MRMDKKTISWCEKRLFNVIPIESLFVLIGFFLVAFELNQKNESGNENDKAVIFKILLRSFTVGVGIFVIAHIVTGFLPSYVSIFIESILGLSYMILLYVLKDKMRIIFIKVGRNVNTANPWKQINQ